MVMTIVVVEDHTLIRDMLVVTCREAFTGSVVHGARDAASGLAVCKAERPDLVFLDLALPDRDGLDLLPDLFKACPDCKVIALSGYTDEFTLHRALKSHVHGFLDKSEQPLESLREAVRGNRNVGEFVTSLLSPSACEQCFATIQRRLTSSSRSANSICSVYLAAGCLTRTSVAKSI